MYKLLVLNNFLFYIESLKLKTISELENRFFHQTWLLRRVFEERFGINGFGWFILVFA